MFIKLKKIFAISGLLALMGAVPVVASSLESDPISTEFFNRFEAKISSPEFAHVPMAAIQLIRDNANALYNGTCVDLADVKAKYNQIIATMVQHNVYTSPYFYELSDKKGRKTYLLGSQHTAPLIGLCPSVRAYVTACPQLWSECDGGDQKVLEKLYSSLIKKGFGNYPLDTWAGQLTPDALNKVHFFIQYFQTHHGLNVSSMHPMVFFYMMDEMKLSGPAYAVEREDFGIDSDLINCFKAVGKPVHHLETSATRMRDESGMDELLAALRGQPLATSVQFLNDRCVMAGFLSQDVNTNGKCVLEDLAYLFGLVDLNEIDQYDNHHSVDGKSIRDVSMENRNKRWHGVIKKAQKAGVFKVPNTICVGVAHLPGPTGLLPFYFRNGHTIKRMDRNGQFTISAFEDDQGRWIESIVEQTIPQPMHPGTGSLVQIKASLKGKLSAQEIAAIPAQFNPQIYADLYHNWVATRDPNFQMDEVTYATFFYAHFILPKAKTAASKLVFVRSPNGAPADFDARRYLEKYPHIRAEADDLKIDHVTYAKAHYLHYKDVLGVSDK